MQEENHPKWKEPHIGDTPIFHWTMIMGGRVYFTWILDIDGIGVGKTFHRRMILDISWRWDNCVILGWSLSGKKTLGHWQQPLPQCFPVDKNRYENKLDLVINYEDSLSYGSICMCNMCKYIPYLEDPPRTCKWLVPPTYKPWSSAIWKGNHPIYGTYDHHGYIPLTSPGMILQVVFQMPDQVWSFG